MGVRGLRLDPLEATPFGSEKRHGTALQRGAADAFIEALNVLGDRAEGRDLVIERVARCEPLRKC